MDIIRNSVWLSQGTDLLAEGLYRVLDFDRKVDLLILFKIKSERTGKPIPFSFSMFKYYIESNSITCKDYIYPSYMLVDEKELTDKDRGRRDENYNIIKDLVDDRMFLFDYALHKKSHLLMDGFAPIFPDTCYHLTHYWLAAVDIPVASDNPVHYADAIRYNARTPLQGSLLPLTRLVWA